MERNEKSDELVAPFMIAEFSTLTRRILSIEQTRATRVNYYIVIISAAIAGISLSTKFDPVPASLTYQILTPVILAIVFFLGIAIMRENIVLAAQAVYIYRRAGRIRRWFHDRNSSIMPYLPWSIGDDTPSFVSEPEHSTFAGKDSILWVGNSISGAALILSLLLLRGNPLPTLPAYSIALITFFVIWYGQNIYINFKKKKYEEIGKKPGRIHFPKDELTNEKIRQEL